MLLIGAEIVVSLLTTLMTDPQVLTLTVTLDPDPDLVLATLTQTRTTLLTDNGVRLTF